MAVAHPKLPPEVVELLGIPALEHTVQEVLDDWTAQSPSLDALQVRHCVFSCCEQRVTHWCERSVISNVDVL